MAKLPPSGPRIERAMSAMTLPISLKSTCATNTLSPSPDGMGESQVTTLVPAACAAAAARRDLVARVVGQHDDLVALRWARWS